MYKSLLLAMASCLLFTLGSKAQFNNIYSLTTPPVFGASPFQDSIWAHDTTNFNIVYRMGFTLPGFTITGCNALTVNPCNGQVYGVFKVAAVSGRVLCKVDLNTATLTQVGNLGDNFSSITFINDTTLLGATGDGASVPESMFRINLSNASTTLLYAMGNGNDGEVICYNKDDGMIYHWSGNGTVVFEKFPPNVYTPTNIPFIGSTSGEIFGAMYLGGGRFLVSDISSNYRILFSNGTYPATTHGLPDDLRGLAMPNRWLFLAGNDTICANDSTELLVTTSGSAFQWTRNGTPIPGATASSYFATQAGHYNCLITVGSCADTALFGIDIATLNVPVVAITPSGTAYMCDPNDNVQLTGSGGGTSQWLMNGAPIPGANTNTYTATAPGLYNMIKTNQNGCSDTAPNPTVVMLAPQTITLGPSDTLLACFGDAIQLTIISGAANYEWQLNNVLDTTTTGDSLSVLQGGTYTVITTYGTCVDTSNTVFVDFAPQYTMSPSGSSTICNNQNEALTASPSGATYSWLLNGAPIPGANSQNFNATQQGVYTCLITMPGCTDTTANSLNLTVVSCLGMKEEAATFISLYPNPASDVLYIQTMLPDGEKQLVVTDISGKVVYTANVYASTLMQIPLEGFSKGNYVLKLTHADGVLAKPFVIK